MKQNHIPDFILERFLLNELPEEDLKKIKIEIKNNPALLKRIESIENSNQEILSNMKPDDFVKAFKK